MRTFHVSDMTCGHCASTISSALKRLDPKVNAEVHVAQRLVVVRASTSTEEALRGAIEDAGYTVARVQAEPPAMPARTGGGRLQLRRAPTGAA